MLNRSSHPYPRTLAVIAIALLGAVVSFALAHALLVRMNPTYPDTPRTATILSAQPIYTSRGKGGYTITARVDGGVPFTDDQHALPRGATAPAWLDSYGAWTLTSPAAVASANRGTSGYLTLAGTALVAILAALGLRPRQPATPRPAWLTVGADVVELPDKSKLDLSRRLRRALRPTVSTVVKVDKHWVTLANRHVYPLRTLTRSSYLADGQDYAVSIDLVVPDDPRVQEFHDLLEGRVSRRFGWQRGRR